MTSRSIQLGGPLRPLTGLKPQSTSASNPLLALHAEALSRASLLSQTLVANPRRRAYVTRSLQHQISGHGPGETSQALSRVSYLDQTTSSDYKAAVAMSSVSAGHPRNVGICAGARCQAQIGRPRPGARRSTSAGSRRPGGSGLAEPSDSATLPGVVSLKQTASAPQQALKPYKHGDKAKCVQTANLDPLGPALIGIVEESKAHSSNLKAPLSPLQDLPKPAVKTLGAHAITATSDLRSKALEAAKVSEASRAFKAPEEFRSSTVSEPSKPSGSLLGAVALITGTSVGAGILALPGISAPAGFVPATSIMLGCWGFLVAEALLLAEVNVALMKRVAGDENRASNVLSLRTMAQKTLGPVGGAGATLAYVFLTYTLLTAYVAKSADVLSLLSGLPTEWAGVAFVGCFGAALLVGGNVFTDYVNRAATGVMLALFMVLVGGGSLFADWSVLEQADWRAAPAAVPIIFLSLVYHDLTPVLCSYLDGDIVRIRRAIVGGSLVPLLMFISCNAVALAVSPVTGGGDPLNIIVRLGGPGPAAMIEAFSLLAISTSLIGTLLGASEFALEQLGGLLFGQKQPPHSGRSAPVDTRGNNTDSEAGLKAGLGFTKADLKGSGAEGGPADDGELIRLQKRVEAQLVQWKSRFEREALDGGNGRSSEVYGVTNIDDSVDSVFGFEEGIHSSAGFISPIVGSSELVVRPPGVITQNHSCSQNQSALQGNSVNMPCRCEQGDGFQNSDTGRSGKKRSEKSDGESLGGIEAESLSTGTSATGGVNWGLRTGAFCLVLVPPVAVASQYPDAFFQASNIAGAYGMTTLYGVFPVAMAWSMRSSVKRCAGTPDDPEDYVQLVPGGRFALASMGFVAAAIMVGQAVLDGNLAASAIPDAFTEVGPALEAAQDAAALVGAALSDACGHVQSWANGANPLDTVRNFIGQSIAARYFEVSKLLGGWELDDLVRYGVDSARVNGAGLTGWLDERGAELSEAFEELAAMDLVE